MFFEAIFQTYSFVFGCFPVFVRLFSPCFPPGRAPRTPQRLVRGGQRLLFAAAAVAGCRGRPWPQRAAASGALRGECLCSAGGEDHGNLEKSGRVACGCLLVAPVALCAKGKCKIPLALPKLRPRLTPLAGGGALGKSHGQRHIIILIALA